MHIAVAVAKTYKIQAILSPDVIKPGKADTNLINNHDLHVAGPKAVLG